MRLLQGWVGVEGNGSSSFQIVNLVRCTQLLTLQADEMDRAWTVGVGLLLDERLMAVADVVTVAMVMVMVRIM
jgi:hypothetical protein